MNKPSGFYVKWLDGRTITQKLAQGYELKRVCMLYAQYVWKNMSNDNYAQSFLTADSFLGILQFQFYFYHHFKLPPPQPLPPSHFALASDALVVIESPFSHCEQQPLMRLLSHTPYRINRLQQPITSQTQPGPRQTAASPHRTGDCSLWLIGGGDKQRQRSWRVRAECRELEGGRRNAHLYFPSKGKKSGFPPSNYPPDGISNEEGEKVTDCLSEEYLFKQQWLLAKTLQASLTMNADHQYCYC